jgi:hypothetical protein
MLGTSGVQFGDMRLGKRVESRGFQGYRIRGLGFRV